MNKKAEFDFVWLFAIIAGAAILILAVYGASKIGNTQRYEGDTEAGKKISILINPLQAGYAEGSFGKISFKQETKINNFCSDIKFGINEISVSTQSDVGEKWQTAGAATSIYNKYIFSNNQEQGKEFYVFSKPFYFPYKVSNLVFLNSKKYCFKNIPEEFESLINLNAGNIEIENCSSDSIVVCFSGVCNIRIYGTCLNRCSSIYEEGYVEKNGVRFDYAGNLIFAAVFSDKEVYECNVKRLMYRTSEIADILLKKASLMDGRGCDTNLETDLILLKAIVSNASSEDLASINQIIKDMERKNENELCGLW